MNFVNNSTDKKIKQYKLIQFKILKLYIIFFVLTLIKHEKFKKKNTLAAYILKRSLNDVDLSAYFNRTTKSEKSLENKIKPFVCIVEGTF
jgi:hypothetical protein